MTFSEQRGAAFTEYQRRTEHLRGSFPTANLFLAHQVIAFELYAYGCARGNDYMAWETAGTIVAYLLEAGVLSHD